MSRRLFIFLCFMLFLSAAIFRLWHLGEKSFWVDETKALKDCAPSLKAVYWYCVTGHTPPLREAILHYLGQVPRSYSEFVARVPSALAGALTVPLIFILGRLLLGAGPGLFAALILLIHPWHMLHSQDNRMHSVFLLMATLNLYVVARLLYDRRAGMSWWRWALWGFVAALSAYFSYLAIFPVLGLAATVLWEAAKRFRQRKRDPERARKAKRILLGAALAGAVFLILYAPWIMTGLQFTNRAKALLGRIGSIELVAKAYGDSPPALTPPSPASNLRPPTPAASTPLPVEPPFTTHYGLDYFSSLAVDLSGGSIAVAILSLILAIIGTAAIILRHRPIAPLFVFWFLSPLPAMFLTHLGNYFPSRYLIYYLALYPLLIGYGAYLLFLWLRGNLAKLQSLRPKIAFALAAAIALGPLLALESHGLSVYYAMEKQDWRGAMRYLATNMRDGEALILGDHWTYYGILPYGMRPTIIVNALSLGAFQKALEQYPDAWYIYWAPLPPYIEDIVNRRFKLQAEFPGMLGNVKILRATGAPKQ